MLGEIRRDETFGPHRRPGSFVKREGDPDFGIFVVAECELDVRELFPHMRFRFGALALLCGTIDEAAAYFLPVLPFAAGDDRHLCAEDILRTKRSRSTRRQQRASARFGIAPRDVQRRLEFRRDHAIDASVTPPARRENRLVCHRHPSCRRFLRVSFSASTRNQVRDRCCGGSRAYAVRTAGT